MLLFVRIGTFPFGDFCFGPLSRHLAQNQKYFLEKPFVKILSDSFLARRDNSMRVLLIKMAAFRQKEEWDQDMEPSLKRDQKEI